MRGIRTHGWQLLDLLFPPRCAGCGATGAVLCAACLDSMRPQPPPLCVRCGQGLARSPLRGGHPPLCAPCAAGQFPPHLDGVRITTAYDGAARKAIRALKFGGQRRLAIPLGELLAETYRHTGLSADVIVPVPLHRARQRERGYNQAALLAQQCAAHLRLPCAEHVLVRVRPTAAQSHLSATDRRVNLAGAFAPHPRQRLRLEGQRLLLVDDVMTTGSTLGAAADALKGLRPAAIWGIAIARPGLRREGDRAGDREPGA